MTAGYQTVISSTGSIRKLIITNSLDTDTTISIDGGTTDFIVLPAFLSLVLDLDTSMHWSGVVSAKYTSLAPAIGSLCVGVIKGN